MCIRDRYNDINKYRELFMSETSLDVDSKMGYIDIKAVSYTHLDVYKRQYIHRL